MDAFLKDLKHSARMFRRSPGFTLTAIAALPLGIATNTAIFSVVNTILLKPFAYPDPERVVMFQNVFPAGRSGSAAPTEFNWWRQQTVAFQDVSAYDFNIANLTGESLPEQIPLMHVSANFFRLCGAYALKGRTFIAADDLPNAPKTAVLAYAFWQRHFGGDPHVIGRRMNLSGERYEIIGVLGTQLQNGQVAERSTLSGDIEINSPPDVYIAFQIDPHSASQGHYFNVAGRLKPGVTIAAAQAQVQVSYPEFARKWPGIDFPGREFGIQPLQAAIVGGVRNSLLILLGAVGLVLLIALANVANLLLARATGRKREIAIRAAVGAGRGRIIRQLLTESVMLSLAGGVLGLVASYAGIRAILSLIPGNIPRIGTGGVNVSLDWRVLVFTLALSILTGILFGLVPALESSRADLSRALKESSNRSGTGFRHNQTRAILVTTEMALAVVLLIGAALLIRSFLAIRRVNPGFDAHNVLTVRMSLTGAQFEKPAGATEVIHEGVRRLRALPGVEVAATTCCVPLEDRLRGAFQIAGRPTGSNAGGLTGWTLVSAGYFEAFQIPVLQGRAFSERDESGPPVVIINQTAAKRYWPAGDPLRDRIFIGDQTPRQIIGVVGDVREEALNRDPRPNVYLPSVTGNGMLKLQPWAWVIRTRVAPLSLRVAIQKELREASGGLPVGQVRTMEETLSRSMAAENFNTLVLTIFGCSALLLAAIGIYGLMAYSVAQRVPEIGIRLALGAASRDIRKMVVVQGLRPALAGVVCGLAAALGLTRLLASSLFGVMAWDPLVFTVVLIVLVSVALVAVWLPAMRASRVDPIQALRYE
ncbi:MAG TPA: ABC transporter permease [Bryobacteraceae bacterium]|nr:ABC transporter permease [Bryobacteraceae bacterium]